MKAFEATYSMGGIATGGYFRSIVICDKNEDVNRLLNETHDEDVSNLHVAEFDFDASEHIYEQVLTTDYA